MTWQSLNWIIFVVTIWVITFGLVKGNRIKELASVAIWGGVALTIFVQIMGIHIFNLWKFRYDYFTVLGIPLSLVVAWAAEVILFANFFPSRPIWQGIYIFTFAFVSMILNVYFKIIGLQILIRWNIFYTFLLAIVIHGFIAYVIIPLTGRVRKEM